MTNGAMTLTEKTQIKQRGDQVLQKAQALKVNSKPTYDIAAEFLKDAKTAIALVDEKLGPIYTKQRAAMSETKGLMDEMKAVPKEAERIVKEKMGAYAAEQRRKEDEARRKAEEEARKIAEAERKKEIAEQERLRKIAEAQREKDLAEAKKLRDKAALEALKKQQEIDRRLAAEEAERIKNAPIEVDVEVKRKIPKHDGVTARQKWSAEVYDMTALVEAVAAKRAPLDLLQPNMVNLNTIARERKTPELGVPGVKGVAEEVIGASARE